MQLAGCSVLITSPAQVRLCEDTLAKLDDANVIVLSTIRQVGTNTSLDHVKNLEDILEAGKALNPSLGVAGTERTVNGGELAFLCSTSGTSGEKVRTSCHIDSLASGAGPV